jgi:predicted transposase/invertase (TIGR01784 family)
MGQQTPHDRFIHEVLSNKANAVDFLQGALPNDLLRHLDLRSLKQDKTKYTDEQLNEYFSDIVYTCKYMEKYPAGYTQSGIKLALLFEHKSFVPSFPHTQLLRYILNIWNYHRDHRREVPIVLPILFYHGKKKWKKRPLSRYLSGDTDHFSQFIPEFEYLLIDLSTFSDEEIKTVIFTRTAVKIALLVQKNIFRPEKLRKHLNDFFKLGILYFKEEEGLRFLESVCKYIYTAAEISAEEILKAVENLPEHAEEVFMTAAEQLRKEGREEGQKEANIEHARKMLIKGYPIEDVCEITGLTPDEVRKLQENM